MDVLMHESAFRFWKVMKSLPGDFQTSEMRSKEDLEHFVEPFMELVIGREVGEKKKGVVSAAWGHVGCGRLGTGQHWMMTSEAKSRLKHKAMDDSLTLSL